MSEGEGKIVRAGRRLIACIKESDHVCVCVNVSVRASV